MNNYKKNHPSLDPLASGADDDLLSAAAVNAGEPMDDIHVHRAEMQYVLRKALRNHGRATNAEVRDAKKRKVSIEFEHLFDAFVTPAWAQQIQQQMQQNQQQMQEQMQQMQEQMQHMQEQMQHMQEQMQHMQEQMQQILQTQMQMQNDVAFDRARSDNRSSVRDVNSHIVRVPNRTGLNVPDDQWYPANPTEIANATRAQVNSLLDFYLQPTDGTLVAKRLRLQRHLGVFVEK